MAEVLQLRRGAATAIAGFTGAQGEVVVDVTNWRLVLQDGSTLGGIPLARLSDLPVLGVTSVAGRSGAVTLGLGDVPGAAPLASPDFTGTPTAPTPAAGDASTRLATTAFVAAALAPGAATTVAQGAAGSTIGVALLEELVTLSGSASSSTIAIPNRAIVFAVSCRTVTAITGAPSFGVGVAGNPTQFGAALAIAAGSSNAGVIGPTAFYSPTNIILTPTSGSFTGGSVRIALHFMLCGAPTS